VAPAAMIKGALSAALLTSPMCSSDGREPTVWQLHWLVQWLIVAWLEASRPQQHKLVALLNEGVCWRVDRALAAAKHKV
jgi:hypothetical protein